MCWVMLCSGDAMVNTSFLLGTWGLLSSIYNLVIASGKWSVKVSSPQQGAVKAPSVQGPCMFSTLPVSPTAPGNCQL